MKNLVLLILFILTIPNIILSQSKNEELLYSVEFSKENSRNLHFQNVKKDLYIEPIIRKRKKYKHVSGR